MSSSKIKRKVPASQLAVGYFKHEVICQAAYDTSYLIFRTTDFLPRTVCGNDFKTFRRMSDDNVTGLLTVSGELTSH